MQAVSRPHSIKATTVSSVSSCSPSSSPAMWSSWATGRRSRQSWRSRRTRCHSQRWRGCYIRTMGICEKTVHRGRCKHFYRLNGKILQVLNIHPILRHTPKIMKDKKNVRHSSTYFKGKCGGRKGKTKEEGRHGRIKWENHVQKDRSAQNSKFNTLTTWHNTALKELISSC